jgi:glycerol-3-phosphate dehydrogenase
MPILNEVYRILYEGSTPQNALNALMKRDLKEEWDLA